MKNLIYVLFLFLIYSCDQNSTNNYQEKPKETAPTDSIIKPTSYEFQYNGMTISVQGKKQDNDFKGRILLFEKEIQIFRGKEGEKYFINNIDKKDKSFTLFAVNNRGDKASFKFSVSNKKTQLEADLKGAIAKFNITQGDYSEIPLYGLKNDDSKTDNEVKSTTDNKKDSLYNWNKEYKSSKYAYSIRIPETFSKTKGNRPHIDLKFADAFGSSFLVNVSPRQPDEYKITAHDYTKEMLEQSYKQGTPNMIITYSEKLIVSGEKAFLIEYENAFPNLKSMECYIYYKDYAFVLTGTCEISKFSNYKTLFKNCITSLKL